MRVTTLAAALLLAASGPATAQAPIRYEISFPNAVHHEARVTVVFPDLNPGPLELRMSRTSPGRYALHEFAKNVYDLRATGADGRAVRVERPSLHQWNVSDHGGEVRIDYTLYGDRADGTYTGIDRTHAHLNMPATFLWARGLGARAVELVVRVPEGSAWRVATQLAATDDPYRFTAPDLAYFMDSPTEVSDFWEDAWQVQGPDGPQTIRIALHHTGTADQAEAYARGARTIVDTEMRVFGAFPRFDHGTYTFLACYLPWADGDGMEHRNSTVLTSTGSLEGGPEGRLGTVAHEFFHAWNMERIRSAELEPFDFENAEMSRELWFGEGFTSYYTDLSMWRAGIRDDAEFAAAVGRAADAAVNARGRRYRSPIEMSMQAPFVDAAVSVDPTNFANTFLSYYTWGEAIGLGLDLTLRTRFPGVTLDDLMREMWRTHGSPEVPYGVEDVEAALARVTGDEAFARTFFDRYVRGRDVVDYATLLAAAGIRLAPAEPGRASLGPATLGSAEGGVVLKGATLFETPLYEAGVDRGDRIVSVAGRTTRRPEDVEVALEGKRPGARVELRWTSRGEERRATVTLMQDETLAGALDPSASAEANRFREAWKGGHP
jgi:predicted metalloprotease with PDZ domain